MISSKFKIAAGAVAGLALGTYSADAHYTHVPSKVREEHASFLSVMMEMCCYGHEVTINVTEDSGSSKMGYNITIPAGAYPKQDKDQAIFFPPAKIKTRDDIQAACLKAFEGKPEELETCEPIPGEYNVVFVNPTNFNPLCFLPRENGF